MFSLFGKRKIKEEKAVDELVDEIGRYGETTFSMLIKGVQSAYKEKPQILVDKDVAPFALTLALLAIDTATLNLLIFDNPELIERLKKYTFDRIGTDVYKDYGLKELQAYLDTFGVMRPEIDKPAETPLEMWAVIESMRRVNLVATRLLQQLFGDHVAYDTTSKIKEADLTPQQYVSCFLAQAKGRWLTFVENNILVA